MSGQPTAVATAQGLLACSWRILAISSFSRCSSSRRWSSSRRALMASFSPASRSNSCHSLARRSVDSSKGSATVEQLVPSIEWRQMGDEGRGTEVRWSKSKRMKMHGVNQHMTGAGQQCTGPSEKLSSLDFSCILTLQYTLMIKKNLFTFKSFRNSEWEFLEPITFHLFYILT